MNHLKLDKNWIVFYFPEFNGKLMHIYHIKCAVSRGTSTHIKWMKCPKCKNKLSSWLLDKSKIFIKAHQIADLDIKI